MLTRKQALRLVILFIIVFILVPSLVLAQQNILPSQIVPESCNQVGGCQSVCDLAVLAQNVLNAGIYIAVFLAAFLFAWSGWRYLTSVAGGEISKAKETFLNVMVGLVIILGGWLVIDTLMKVLTGGKFGPWNKVCSLLLQAIMQSSGLA